MRDRLTREQRKAFRKEKRKEFMKQRKRSGSVLAGLLLLCIGTLLLLKQFGIPFPEWLFTWPMIIIAFGLLAGAGNAFRDPGWIIITGVGFVFLLGKIWTSIPLHHFVWPILIIALGLIFILAPRRHRIWHVRYEKYKEMEEQYKQRGEEPPKWHEQWWQQPQDAPNQDATQVTTPQDATGAQHTSAWQPNTERKGFDNWLDTVTIFSSVKKQVFSKNFKGGDIVSIFGGAEINLSQADFNGSIAIEVVQIFGGTKLIIPPHWQIRSEMVAIFGGIEDKRPPQMHYDEDKVVVLNGTTFFGGIEIKSY